MTHRVQIFISVLVDSMSLLVLIYDIRGRGYDNGFDMKERGSKAVA